MRQGNLARIVVFLGIFSAICGEMVAQDSTQDKLNIYGYFSTRFEKVWNEPSLDGNTVVKETPPAEWSVPFFNLMAQEEIGENFRVFINLNGSGAGELEVRNFWGEYSASQAFNVRLGKIYRKFGLYNEILDAVPSYYGIEPPELFDKDHLILSRTTTLMVFGGVPVGSGTFNYSFTNDSGEGDAFSDAFPLGYDFNYKSLTGSYTLGVSGYTSGGPANSDVGIGEGSPRSGVLPWMEEDRFHVFGGYAEVNFGDLTLQGEYWNAQHDALRDAEKTVEMIQGGKPNASQLARFLYDPSGPADVSNVNPNGDYSVNTWYVRAGYTLWESEFGEFGPYFQWDYYSNPETIAKKTFGGDNEAGASTDGKFDKLTLGMVYRPRPEVAVKFDTSWHYFELAPQTVNYPEIRLDVSYVFGQ